jgi:HPt (histidine-containing phosphotransfer) domain-containing protein
MDAIRKAVAAKDPALLVHPAHSLKSDSANLGAKALSASCKQLEEIGRVNSLQGADKIVAELEAHYASACAALRDEREKAA